jgi:hypothetical protein
MNHPATITPERMAAIAASVAAPAIVHEPRFANVSCSQCGQSFGPGASGYSHCWDHWPTGECASTLGTLDVSIQYRCHSDDEDGLDLAVTRVSFGGKWIEASPDEFSDIAIDKWHDDAVAHYQSRGK